VRVNHVDLSSHSRAPKPATEDDRREHSRKESLVGIPESTRSERWQYGHPQSE